MATKIIVNCDRCGADISTKKDICKMSIHRPAPNGANDRLVAKGELCDECANIVVFVSMNKLQVPFKEFVQKLFGMTQNQELTESFRQGVKESLDEFLKMFRLEGPQNEEKKDGQNNGAASTSAAT